jgi:hypothetical protein
MLSADDVIVQGTSRLKHMAGKVSETFVSDIRKHQGKKTISSSMFDSLVLSQ